ncbi:dual 3',5'-cyclic-AMP and -GMP phosphodiesterase 11 isoform X2 [Dermacentor albipictus]|uniref:dual 3',5'-cyclic-AMP and -GMP phosphodiesterase 11 isoform X2 n=1 Tax=Dermacentor albipictus TaxID=60249 RepID=UPI0038FCA23D
MAGLVQTWFTKPLHQQEKKGDAGPASGKRSRLAAGGETSGGGGRALWRPLWQPGWHPRGAPPPLLLPAMKASEGAGGAEQLEEARVEAWLDEHPAFVGDYFMRKASRKVVDSWLLAHAVPQSVVQATSPCPADQAAGSSASSSSMLAAAHSLSSSSSSLNGGSSSGAGANISPPMRKISACEFDRGSPLRPIVQTSFDGTPTFLTLPAAAENQSGVPGVPSGAGLVRPKRRSRQELQALNERELIFELVKDICNELDIRLLCHKILQNVTVITDADRCSLFLVHGDRDSPSGRCLVSQLFDVSCRSTLDQVRYEEVRVPWGSGIVGYVAQSKEAVNIPDCYNDSRFNKSIDLRTGYRTRCMLCMPIFDRDGEVIGVAQVINKKGRNEHDVFNSNDEKVFSEYLQFCGLVLRNAQLYERSELENKRNQVLLDLARMVFEEQSTIEQVVYRIMTHMQSLLECERCQVLLVDHETRTAFHRVFDLEAKDALREDVATCTSPYEGRFPINTGITGSVVATGQILNIPDAYKDDRFDPKVDEGSSFRHKSILCIPIYNANRLVLGVAQLINKLNGEPFNKNDEQLLEAFAIFCGLGIQNTQMYEKVVKAMAKQRVTLEVLSYHASAPLEEALKLSECVLPSMQSLRLQDYKFNDFSLDDDGMLKACLRIFLELDFLNRFHIEYLVLCRWLLSVKKNYRKVSYHNWRHAFNVGQMMFSILTNTKLHEVLGDLETFGLIMACLCHDLDHRGTNNSFQIKSSSPLAQLYSTSTMEHHHFDQCVMILNSQGNQILSHVSPEEYTTIIRIVEEAILATDLAVYFRKRGQFFKLVENDEYQWTNSDHRELLRNMLMTACDIGAITKPWDVQRVVADLVTMEFFQQGDMEKKVLNLQPIDMMNREKKDQLPAMQLGFIDSICLPLYRSFSALNDRLYPLLEGVELNRMEWKRLADAHAADINGDRSDSDDPDARKKT